MLLSAFFLPSMLQSVSMPYYFSTTLTVLPVGRVDAPRKIFFAKRVHPLVHCVRLSGRYVRRLVVTSFVRTACRASFTNDYPRQSWQRTFHSLPDPFSEIFTRRIVEPWNLVQVMVIDLLFQGRECVFDVRKINNPSEARVHWTTKMNLDTKGMAVESAALVSQWDIGQFVSSLDFEFSEYVHSRPYHRPGILRIWTDILLDPRHTTS